MMVQLKASSGTYRVINEPIKQLVPSKASLLFSESKKWYIFSLPTIPSSPQISENFSYGDATPAALGIVPAGKVIELIELIITEVFNGASPSLKIGDIITPDSIMTASENDPTSLGNYEAHPDFSFGTAKTLYLTIVPGAGATTGKGLVVITFQK